MRSLYMRRISLSIYGQDIVVYICAGSGLSGPGSAAIFQV